MAHIALVGETDLHRYLAQPDVRESLRKRISDSYPSFYCDAIVDRTQAVRNRAALEQEGVFAAQVLRVADEQVAHSSEMVNFVHPSVSFQQLETLVKEAEEVLTGLGLAFRVIMLSSGDMGFSAAKCYDLELWAPGEQQWLEVSSCSCFTDYQARRLNCRFKDSDGKTKLVHTLNGSGVALPRLVVALLEQHLNEDGSVTIPEVLRPYMGGKERLEPVK